MPILKPEIQRALRASGLTKENNTDIALSDRLQLAGLDLENVLDKLSDLINNSTNEVTKRQAIDTALKLHGVLKEQAAPPPSITIVINDNESLEKSEVNPILIPRGSTSAQKELVN